MKVAASPRSRAQVAAVLAFVISHTTFLTAQDDETGRCSKGSGQQVSRLSLSDRSRLNENDKDFSATLSMTIRERLMSSSLLVFPALEIPNP